MTSLFRTAFLQVFYISCNTICLARGIWPGVAFFSFMISYTWVSNVRKVQVSDRMAQVVYATGAMCGALAGLILINNINNLMP